MNRKVFINTEYITLGQMLKYENILDSGGLVKDFLLSKKVTVNKNYENRRGKKLFPGDIVGIEKIGIFEIVKK